MSLMTTVSKVKKICDESGLDLFLIGDSAKGVDTKDDKVFMFGCKAEDFEKIGEQPFVFGEKIEGAKIDFVDNRAFKIRDTEGNLVIIAAYFLDGDMRYCPYSNKKGSLRFPDALLDEMKKKKIGTKYFYIPTPIEDYLTATFTEDGKFNVTS